MLGNIADIQTGPFGSQLHKSDYVADGTPIVTVEHLGNRKLSHEAIPFINEQDKIRLSKYCLNPGDLVFSRVGSVDRCSYIFEEENGWLFSGRCLRIRPNETKIDSKYLYYYFCLDSIKKHIRSIAVGATMPSINTKILSEIKIFYPSLNEQKKIGAILSFLDDKIELNNRINKNLEEMAQAIFKRWFVDFEFPDENGNPYKSSGGEMVESELGEIPKGWKVTKFEDAFNFQEGPGIRNWQYVTNGGTKFINIRCIKNNDLFLETANMISNEEANGVYSHFMINEWDVLVSTSGTLGRYAIVRKEHLPLCLNTSVIRFMPKSHFDHFAFMMGYISSEEFINHLLTKASGSVQSNFGPMHLRQISIKYPLDTVIQKYQMLVFPLINQAVKLKSENQLLTKTRDVLLPKLMSGEIRVPCEEAV